MTKITFDRWDGGLDVRGGASTADANRLRVLRNCYVTTAKKIRKRPGLVHVADVPSRSVGLFAGLGVLNTFQLNASDDTGTPLIVNRKLDNAGLSFERLGVYDCKVFAGNLYVSASHSGMGISAENITTGENIRHHYLDGGSSTVVTGAPQSPAIAVIESRVWAGNADFVSHCALTKPRDWATTGDAGFLPVGRQAQGSKYVTALGTYNNKLIAFTSDAAQVWQIDADPNLNTLTQTVDIGTNLPWAHANLAGDVFFLAPLGVRSIVRQSATDNLIDTDVGAPIDTVLSSLVDTKTAKGVYLGSLGQYWLYSGSRAVVFTFSRSAKINAWSVYDFPIALDFVTELNGKPYMRSANSVYRMDVSSFSDNGAVIPVEIETSFVDFKAPGDLKQVLGLDAVCEGSCDITHRFDPRQPSLETSPAIPITGDSRPGYLYPVELMTTNLSTVIRSSSAGPFELQSLTYHFENLGAI